MGWQRDLRAKLQELAWLVVVAVLRWGLERLVSNPGVEENSDAETKSE